MKIRISRPTTAVWLGVLVLIGIAALLLARGMPFAEDREIDEAIDAAEDAARDPTLVGTGQAPVNPYADVTDVSALLPASGGGSPAQLRLVELVERDPSRMKTVVAWMHPDRDEERNRPWQGVQYSGPLHPGLQALCDTFRRLGPAGVEALAAALEDEDAEMRRRAATCLGSMGPSAAAAVPALLLRLEGEREDAAGKAVILRALGAMGVAAAAAGSAFNAVLRDVHAADSVRVAAAEGLLDVVGLSDEALDTCAAVLQDQSFDVCATILPEIAARGPAAASLAPALADLIRDDEAHGVIVQHAVYALGQIDSAEAATVGHLVRTACDERREDALRIAAARAVASFGDDAIDALLEGIEASDDATRLLLIRALSGGEIDPGRLLGALDAIRASEWEEDRVRAVAVGDRVQAPVDVLVPWLRTWLGDPDPMVRQTVLGAVDLVRDEQGLVAAVLAEAVGDPAIEVRRSALFRLSQRWDEDLGDRKYLAAKPLVDAALLAFEGGDAMLRAAGAEALARIAPEPAERLLPYWIDRVRGDHWEPEVYDALEQMGPRAKAAIPALERAVERWKGYEPVRARIAEVLEAVRGS